MWLIFPAVVILPAIGLYLITMQPAVNASDTAASGIDFTPIGWLLLVFFPLLALLMIWISPRRLKAKCTDTIIMLVLAMGLSSYAFLSNRPEPVPDGGINVKTNNQGEFVSKTVFPKEREIYNRVIRQIHEQENKINGQAGSHGPGVSTPESIVDSNQRVLEDVGREYGLETDKVFDIYTKVSSSVPSVSP
jgi:hypothetical protein